MSTTLQLVWGDLLAATLMEARGFNREGFALNHPAGSLGARLLKVRDLMHTDWPRLEPAATATQVLRAITQGHLGMATVEDDSGLRGIISDGDIRRGFERAEAQQLNPLNLRAQDFMTPSPVGTTPDSLAIEAAALLESRKITFLLVREGDRPVGVLHIHDLLSHKVL